jgi:hypothetical protein
MNRLTEDLIAALRAAGLEVVVITGWLARGRPGPFEPVGVLNHHTGASARGWTRLRELAYAKWMFLTGRPDLPAPLCQIALGRSGVVYIGAAGRANHAGTARASGTVAAGDGNTLYHGVEWMLSGTEPIPAEMMEAAVLLNAVLTEKQTRTSVQTISCHYGTSVTGKWDIGDPAGVLYNGKRVLDIGRFRSRVNQTRVRLYEKVPMADEIANINSHGPLGRLGGEAGRELSREWEAKVRKAGNEEIKNGVSTTFTLDTNIRGRFPNLGAGTRRIGGKEIDLIAFRKAVGGASIKVTKRKTIKQYIDGHDAFGVRLAVTFPSGKVRKYWLVQSNLGRGVSDEVFRRHCKRLRKAFGHNAIYNLMEIDEADAAHERAIIREEIFPPSEFAFVGGNRLVMTIIGRRARVKIVRREVKMLTAGMAQVSPARFMIKTVVGPK